MFYLIKSTNSFKVEGEVEHEMKTKAESKAASDVKPNVKSNVVCSIKSSQHVQSVQKVKGPKRSNLYISQPPQCGADSLTCH